MNARSRGGPQALNAVGIPEFLLRAQSVTIFSVSISTPLQERKGPSKETATVHRFVGHVASAGTTQPLFHFRHRYTGAGRGNPFA